jgi:hypothetical protein
LQIQFSGLTPIVIIPIMNIPMSPEENAPSGALNFSRVSSKMPGNAARLQHGLAQVRVWSDAAAAWLDENTPFVDELLRLTSDATAVEPVCVFSCGDEYVADLFGNDPIDEIEFECYWCVHWADVRIVTMGMVKNAYHVYAKNQLTRVLPLATTSAKGLADAVRPLLV